MKKTKIFDFKVRPSQILLEEFEKRGLEYRAHEIAPGGNASELFFAVPSDSQERSLALISIKECSWNKYSKNAEEEFTKYIAALGYKPVANAHPTLLINSLKKLNEGVFKKVGMRWFESLLLVQDKKGYNIVVDNGEDCVFSIQRGMSKKYLFGLHQRIFHEEDAYIVEKI